MKQNPLANYSTPDLEYELLYRAIQRAEEVILATQESLRIQIEKQLARRHELVRLRNASINTVNKVNIVTPSERKR